jgi:DNA repair protein RadA/Sms
VLGGGLVDGSVVLIGGEPGIGKSTLLLQAADALSRERPVLYASGEESVQQVALRARRLGLESRTLRLLAETRIEAILDEAIAARASVLVIDSIQTMHTELSESSPGSAVQVRESAARLVRYAKDTATTVLIIGHVTKEGTIAGPRVLEHIVDTVLYLEGDRYQSYRLLRSVKNRFGATSEVGVFEMRERGMVEVTNPSEAFLAERMVNAPGSAIAVTMEGTRPLLVELQGLTTFSNLGNPRRTPNGVDFNRLLLITAVLTRRLGMRLSDQDIFVNVVGGLTIDEPAADLAVAAAITSSMRDIPVRADAVLIGEVGLSGELRWVGQMPARLREAAKLGFRAAIVPRGTRQSEPWPEGIEILQARSLREALNFALLEKAG